MVLLQESSIHKETEGQLNLFPVQKLQLETCAHTNRFVLRVSQL